MVVDQPYQKFDIMATNSFRETSSVMDISASVKMSFMGGLLSGTISSDLDMRKRTRNS